MSGNGRANVFYVVFSIDLIKVSEFDSLLTLACRRHVEAPSVSNPNPSQKTYAKQEERATKTEEISKVEDLDYSKLERLVAQKCQKYEIG